MFFFHVDTEPTRRTMSRKRSLWRNLDVTQHVVALRGGTYNDPRNF